MNIMKKTPLTGRIFLLMIFVGILLELTFVVVSKGNIVVDLLAFNQFTKEEPYNSTVVLKNNQYIDEGHIYTIVYDSIDFTLFIDDKILTQDTIYHNTGIKLFRDNYYLKPGKHMIRIESKKLDATYSYPFFNFLFVDIFVESSDFPPYFWITKHYLPLRRNEI